MLIACRLGAGGGGAVARGGSFAVEHRGALLGSALAKPVVTLGTPAPPPLWVEGRRTPTPSASSDMAKNLLVINVDIRETRVALIENGIIAELHIERETSRGTLGNIYLGKVSRVLPGMQAAFIDVGLERAAFLHVEDLIRPDDFEAYLSGHRHAAAGARSSGGGAS